VIRCKTALLFQAAAHTAAVLGSDDPDEITALKHFGAHFGLAYQLVDDYLDYAGDADVMGKNAGDDLAEGKTHAAAHSCPATCHASRSSAAEGRAGGAVGSVLDDVLDIVCRCGALDYVQESCASPDRERAQEPGSTAGQPLPGGSGNPRQLLHRAPALNAPSSHRHTGSTPSRPVPPRWRRPPPCCSSW
jgi:octaprenyl-diphosphate synthase